MTEPRVVSDEELYARAIERGRPEHRTGTVVGYMDYELGGQPFEVGARAACARYFMRYGRKADLLVVPYDLLSEGGLGPRRVGSDVVYIMRDPSVREGIMWVGENVWFQPIDSPTLPKLPSPGIRDSYKDGSPVYDPVSDTNYPVLIGPLWVEDNPDEEAAPQERGPAYWHRMYGSYRPEKQYVDRDKMTPEMLSHRDSVVEEVVESTPGMTWEYRWRVLLRRIPLYHPITTTDVRQLYDFIVARRNKE